MTPSTLTRVGQACFGRQWQTQLANAIGVSDRTMRRFVSGEMAIPAGIRDELRALILERREKLADALQDLEN